MYPGYRHKTSTQNMIWLQPTTQQQYVYQAQYNKNHKLQKFALHFRLLGMRKKGLREETGSLPYSPSKSIYCTKQVWRTQIYKLYCIFLKRRKYLRYERVEHLWYRTQGNLAGTLLKLHPDWIALRVLEGAISTTRGDK